MWRSFGRIRISDGRRNVPAALASVRAESAPSSPLCSHKQKGGLKCFQATEDDGFGAFFQLCASHGHSPLSGTL